MPKGKKFTQKEIHEIREIISKSNFPMILAIDPSDNTIDLDFEGDIFYQSIIRKSENVFRIDYVTSRGEDKFYEHKEWNQIKYLVTIWINALKRENPFAITRIKNIDKTSPKYYKYYQEARMIQALGFEESSGMIYRKSLEILVKDSLLKILPESFEKTISKNTIGGLVLNFYEIKDLDLKPKLEKFSSIQEELKNLKPLFKIIRNTFKIGNDFSHYERRLEEFSPADMKNNLDKISNYIDNLIEEINLQIKRQELNKEFDSNELL
jgi:hypothetical protein